MAELRSSLPGMLTDLNSSGRNWAKGKSEQEVARAKEIMSSVIDRIGRLALDEQDQTHRHRLELAQQDVELQSKQTDTYLSAMERAVGIVKELAEMGVDIDFVAILSQIPAQSPNLPQLRDESEKQG